MSAIFYKYMHIIGLLFFFFSMGGLTQGAWTALSKNFAHRKVYSLLHGVGLILILISGFGQWARIADPSTPFPHWLIAKIIIWLLLGLLMSPILRKPLLNKYFWPLTLLLGSTAAYMAIFKPDF